MRTSWTRKATSIWPGTQNPLISRPQRALTTIRSTAAKMPMWPSLNSTGDALVFSTYLGGSGEDRVWDILVDDLGDIFLIGSTTSEDFPTTSGAYDTTFNGDEDVFIAKLNSTGDTLLFSTFLGGSSREYPYEDQVLVLDASGNLCFAGATASADFPTSPDAYDGTHNGDNDAFVVKLSSDCGVLVYSTYLGGSGSEVAHSLAISATGELHVIGTTSSWDFPTTPGANDAVLDGPDDTFVTKFNASCTALAYSTFLGGSAGEHGNRATVDGSGGLYVSGRTDSWDFPVTPGAYDKSFNGDRDAFCAKLDASGQLLAATYIGGFSRDQGHTVLVDSVGNVWLSGFAYSSDFPTTRGAFDRTLSGEYDMFLVSFDGLLGQLLYGTFLGGSDGEGLDSFTEFGPDGSLFLLGRTKSADFPVTPGAYDTQYADSGDLFIAKLDPSAGLGDSDGDGMPDWWENLYGLDPGVNDAAGDLDGDGLTNLDEYNRNTDPDNPDSDGDGYSDGDEVAAGKDPNSASSSPLGDAQNPAQLVWSTFLGGTDIEEASGLAVDTSGNSYVAGRTCSTDFPVTPGAYDESFNGGTDDAYVAKLNDTGDALVFATFLGGSGDDFASDLCVDDAGNIYVVGSTTSADFPTTPGAYDTTFNGSEDVFVAKLNATGDTLLYSTFIGGANDDSPRERSAIVLDEAGSLYIAGRTASSDFPTTSGSYAPTFGGGGSDGFITKLSADGSALVYSTFLGGSADELCSSLAVNAAGEVYVGGNTDSIDFPTTSGAFDTSHGGWGDAYVAKLSADGTALLFSTLIGGSGDDTGRHVALTDTGEVYLSGWTDSLNFPVTSGAYGETFNGDRDGFVVLLDATGSAVLAGTYLSGAEFDTVHELELDGSGNLWVSGMVRSEDFPTTPGAFDRTYNGNTDQYVAEFDASLTTLLYGTFVGGMYFEGDYFMALGPADNIYVYGRTQSKNFPFTPDAYDTTYNGNRDGFVLKLDPAGGTGDADADGMPDWWENLYGLEPNVDDAAGDLDGDGLSNVDEYNCGTRPDYSDTDGDGYTDGDEVHAGTDPNDPSDSLIGDAENPAALEWGTFLGGSDQEEARGLYIDGDGNTYVVGKTVSADFPATAGALSEAFNGGSEDGYVTKFNSTGETLLFSTFLGGSGWDRVSTVVPDGLGNIYVLGDTDSADFPTTAGAYDTTANGGADLFVAKLTGTGDTLLWSTLLGGSGDEEIYDRSVLIVDGSGDLWLSGWTYSADFPTTSGAYDTTPNGGADGFVVKLAGDGSAVLYSTLLGGSDDDNPHNLQLNGVGEVYVVGETWSGDFPVTSGAYDETFNGDRDVFVAKLNAVGDALLYGTYFGGTGRDTSADFLLLPASEEVCISGYTESWDFPTTSGAYDETRDGDRDAFCSILDATGSSLTASTLVGGSARESGNTLALDSGGNIWLSGSTESVDFPTTPGAFDVSLNGGWDEVIVQFDPSLTSLLYSTYVGGASGRGRLLRGVGFSRPCVRVRPDGIAGIPRYAGRL